MRLTATSLIRLYPAAWRERYGDEMRAVLEGAPPRRGDTIDVVRGAADAWLHPARPSRVPPAAALSGGGLWTLAATAVVTAPAPPDWPGYLMEIVPSALVAAGCLLVATLGCALRSDARGGRAMATAVALTTIGYVAWMAALVGTVAGLVDGPTLAAAQALAMIGTALVGMVLVGDGDEVIGPLVVVGAVSMLVPWTVTWLVFGAAWTLIGAILLLERPWRSPTDPGQW